MVMATMSSTPAQQPQTTVLITHPNREKAIVRSTRVVVILLILATAGLLLLITVGGWSDLVFSSLAVQIFFIAFYLLLAFYAGRWNRGVLPVASSLSVLLIIFALTGASGWFDRSAVGFKQPILEANLLGVLTLLLVPVQILLIVFAMRGFQQGWNVELEQRVSAGGAGAGGYGGPAPHPA
jgi:hypothetical protein